MEGHYMTKLGASTVFECKRYPWDVETEPPRVTANNWCGEWEREHKRSSE